MTSLVLSAHLAFLVYLLPTQAVISHYSVLLRLLGSRRGTSGRFSHASEPKCDIVFSSHDRYTYGPYRLSLHQGRIMRS